MPSVKVAVIIRKKKEAVYQALKAVEKFPSFMKDIKEILIKDSSGKTIISDWRIDIEGTPIEWRQESILDETNQDVIYFKMVQGDYEKYEGRWLLKELNGKTKLELDAHFEWGVPGLERFVGKILEEKACQSLKGMLFAIRKELHRT